MVKVLSKTPLSFELEPKFLESRRDVWYYKPEFLIVEEKLAKIKTVPLQDVAEFSKLTINPTQDPNKEFMYIDISSIDTISGEINPQKIIGKEAPSRARKLVKKNDILISTVRPNRNAIAIIPKHLDNSICSTGFAVVQAKKISPYYLFSFMKTKYAVDQLTRRMASTMYPAILEKDVANIRVPLVSKEIQDKIAEIMFHAIGKRKHKLQNIEKLLAKMNEYLLDELNIKLPEIKNYFAFWVSSEELQDRRDPIFYQPKYSQISKAIETGKYKTQKLVEIVEYFKKGVEVGSKAYKEEGILFIRVENIQDFELRTTENSVFIDKDSLRHLQNYVPLKGEILFTKDGTIGRAYFCDDIIEGVISSGILRIKIKEGINPEYITTLLNTWFIRLLFERYTIGAVIKHLSLEKIKIIKLPIPPKTIQDKIAENVRKFRKEREKLKKEADKIIEKAKVKIEKILVN